MSDIEQRAHELLEAFLKNAGSDTEKIHHLLKLDRVIKRKLTAIAPVRDTPTPELMTIIGETTTLSDDLAFACLMQLSRRNRNDKLAAAFLRGVMSTAGDD